MRIGAVAHQAGVSPSIIRYYEGVGLLPSPVRDNRGCRVYKVTDLERIELVAGARRLGVSLQDIREILALHDDRETPSPRILELIRQKASEVDEQCSCLETIKLELCRLRDAAQSQDHCCTADEGTAADASAPR